MSPFSEPAVSQANNDPVLLNDWHVVAKASDLNSDSVRQVRLLGRDLVLWSNSDGVHVWLDLCIHRGAKLSLGRVENDCLVCPYHGWTYGSQGVCQRIPAHPELKPPARARTTTYQSQVAYGLIWVCLGVPVADVPSFPEWHDSRFRKLHAGPYQFRANAPRVIENFLDVGHLPFVHGGILGDPAVPEIHDYEVEVTPEKLIAKDIRIWQPNPDGSGKPGTVSYTFEALRPLTARFSKNQGNESLVMVDIVTPVELGLSKAWPIVAIKSDSEISEEKMLEYQDSVTFQDIPVVESQRPEMLPLDLQAELHLRSDRMAIGYRQWLKKLGMTFGTN
jgi:phenylpropionate dioxygenase-like ring-hydroxylating dioxygenase large terminal subunit